MAVLQALLEFAETSIGRHPNFSVVTVKHHSPKCVIEQIAQGVPVAAAISSADPRKVSLVNKFRSVHQKL